MSYHKEQFWKLCLFYFPALEKWPGLELKNAPPEHAETLVSLTCLIKPIARQASQDSGFTLFTRLEHLCEKHLFSFLRCGQGKGWAEAFAELWSQQGLGR